MYAACPGRVRERRKIRNPAAAPGEKGLYGFAMEGKERGTMTSLEEQEREYFAGERAILFWFYGECALCGSQAHEWVVSDRHGAFAAVILFDSRHRKIGVLCPRCAKMKEDAVVAAAKI
jgi:hypothetical protein